MINAAKTTVVMSLYSKARHVMWTICRRAKLGVSERFVFSFSCVCVCARVYMCVFVSGLEGQQLRDCHAEILISGICHHLDS